MAQHHHLVRFPEDGASYPVRVFLKNDVVTAAIDYVTGFPVAGPEVVSRGFVYEKEAEHLIEDASAAALAVIEEFSNRKGKGKDVNALKGRIRDAVSRLMYERTKRSPIIVPVILEV